MIRDATPADLPLIRRIVAAANDAPYPIEPVVEEKCFGRGLSGEPRVRLFEDAGLAVTCGRYLRLLAVDRERRRRGIGSALLRDSGASVIAAEPGNYFTPGVAESDHGTQAFFHALGFRSARATWNLHVSTSGHERAEHLRVEVGAPLLDFVEREFGSAWRLEVERARSAFTIEGIGFAAVDANNRGLGTFGPTGVIATARGRGHGRTLLRAALAELSRLGYERAVIPWTDAVEFYRRSCGAEPAQRFVTFVNS